MAEIIGNIRFDAKRICAMLVREMRACKPDSEIAGKLERGRLLSAEISGEEIYFDFATEDEPNPPEIIEKVDW